MNRLLVLFLYCFLSLPVSGMPKVVLNPNRPIQQQLAKGDTRYIIKSPIDLQGRTIVVPASSILDFKRKGSLINGTLTGNETTLRNPRLRGILFKGSFANQEVTIDKHFDVETDFWNFIKCFPKADIILERDISLPNPSSKDITIDRFHIDGRGHTIKVQSCPILRNPDVKLLNVTFNCSNAQEQVIYAIGGRSDRHFVIRNCSFLSVPEVMTLCPRAYSDVRIEECIISGILSPQSKRTKEAASQILIYSCDGVIVVKKNQIKNCYGAGIKGIGFKPDDNSDVLIEDNTIDNVANGGIVFAGGEVWNVMVRNNHISHTHALGKQFEGELNGATNSAINFHGFRNVVLESNTVTDCPNSSSLDFDGSIAGSSKVEKGTGLVVKNNSIIRSGRVALFSVQDVDFTSNSIQTDDNNDVLQTLVISGSDNLRIRGNTFRLRKGRTKTYYPIYVTETSTVKSGDITVESNEISTDGDHFIFVNQSFTGNCKIGENTVRSSGRRDGTLNVVNNSRTKVVLPKASKLVRYK